MATPILVDGASREVGKVPNNGHHPLVRAGRTAAAGAPRIIFHAAEHRVLSFRVSKILASARDGIAMSRRQFIDVFGGAAIVWSLAFPDASGQQLRKAYRVGFLALSQLK